MLVIGLTLSLEGQFIYLFILNFRALIEWYNKTPPERRPNLIVSWFIKKFYVVAFLTFVWLLWHWLRQQNHPLTGRECFDAISMDLVNTIQEYKFDQFWEEHAHLVIMNTEHPLYKRAQNVFTR